MPQTDWQSPESYLALRRLEAADWAWEFLRRNPAYRDACRGGPGAGAAPAPGEDPDHWGLRFLV